MLQWQMLLEHPVLHLQAAILAAPDTAHEVQKSVGRQKNSRNSIKPQL
jgi:hypothetical protein